jgi:TPR repeat protein
MRTSGTIPTGTIFGAALALSFAVQAGPEEDYQRGWAAYQREDVSGAMAPLHSAADAGHAKAQALLGYVMHKAGFYKEAFDLYAKAAAQGDADAMYWLGTMYLGGQEMGPPDLDKARGWMEKAAEHGSASAISALAAAYRKGGLGVKADAQKASEYEAQAATLRKQNAGSELGPEDGSVPASGG